MNRVHGFNMGGFVGNVGHGETRVLLQNNVDNSVYF